jgi:hypothetical protein
VLEDYLIHFGADMPADKATAVVEQWRAAAAAKAGADVELAAPLQRHYTKFGTGLPPNFCLALTATEAIAFKFDPRHPAHPLAVNAGQIKREKARWPRAAVRIGNTSRGPLAIGLTLTAEGRDIPCRTPRLAINRPRPR